MKQTVQGVSYEALKTITVITDSAQIFCRAV
nr:MAG TPA: hypothetical protein [Caudoviricetes sp.]